MENYQQYDEFSQNEGSGFGNFGLGFKNMSSEELMKFIMSQTALVVAQAQQVNNVYNEITLMKNEVKSVKRDIMETKEEIQQLRNEIIDEINLDDGQVGELLNQVKNKTIELCIEKHSSNEGWYKYYRKFIMRIWGKTKTRFSANKYINIKRKDFEPAMNFVQNLKLSDLDYETYYDYKQGIAA